MHLLLPLIAAIAFAAGSMVFKRAFAEGATLSHAVVVNNVILGLLFLPLMALDPHPIPWDRWHLPFITASTFVAGHLFNVAALRAGDVSVATPLLGVKVVFVALIARFAFGWPLSSGQLTAAALTSVGVLITGESGLGKSELGLELISRNHGLVADDAVEFLRIAPHMIEGRCPALLQNLLEVRGLGLLDIKTIFGETAVRRKMRLKLIVHLVRRKTLEENYERLPLNQQTQDVLGLPIRKVIIPVEAGRNLAVLLEAAVRNTILQMRGINTLDDFMERQQQAMRDALTRSGIDRSH